MVSTVYMYIGGVALILVIYYVYIDVFYRSYVQQELSKILEEGEEDEEKVTD
jgi:hypothetical protein